MSAIDRAKANVRQYNQFIPTLMSLQLARCWGPGVWQVHAQPSISETDRHLMNHNDGSGEKGDDITTAAKQTVVFKRITCRHLAAVLRRLASSNKE